VNDREIPPNYFTLEDGGSIFLRNAGIYLQVHTALQPRMPTITGQKHKQRIGTSNNNIILLTFLGFLAEDKTYNPLGNRCRNVFFKSVINHRACRTLPRAAAGYTEDPIHRVYCCMCVTELMCLASTLRTRPLR
jgi:hypothetical protein